jgi:hypothetical protein
VLVAILAVTLLVTTGLMMLAREITRLRGTVAQLERRIVALELDGAKTLVIEPDPAATPPPRPRNALVN